MRTLSLVDRPVRWGAREALKTGRFVDEAIVASREWPFDFEECQKVYEILDGDETKARLVFTLAVNSPEYTPGFIARSINSGKRP